MNGNASWAGERRLARVLGFCCMAAFGTFGSAAADDAEPTIDDVIDQIVELVEGHKSYSYEYVRTTLAWDGQSSEVVGLEEGRTSGAYINDELKERDESVGWRDVELYGKPFRAGINSVTVYDAEHVHSYWHSYSPLSGFRYKRKGDINFIPRRGYFESLRKEYSLELRPEELVDGHKVWVIHGTIMPAATSRYAEKWLYIDQATGIWRKTVMKNAEGRPVRVITMNNVRVDVPIENKEFVIELPSGLEWRDGDAPFGRRADTPK